MDLISVGLICVDMNIKPVSAEFLKRDSMHVDIKTLPGGDGCNVVLNAAALGLSASLISAVGNDMQGAWLLEYLRDHGVQTEGILKSDTYGSAISLVMVEPSGERHFLTSTDIFAMISPSPLTDEILAQTRFLTVNSYFRIPSLEGTGGASLLAKARRLGARTAMDVMHCRQSDPLGLLLPVLPHLDYFIPSYDEALQITGERDPARMAEILLSHGCGCVIVKLGEKGCYVNDGRESAYIPARMVPEVVSTTGAGDSFFAGFVAASVRGMPLKEAARFACAAASVTVMQPGASGGILSFEQIRKLMQY